MPRKDKRLKQQELDDVLGNPPEHVQQLPACNNLSCGIYNGGLVQCDSNGDVSQHPDIGKGGRDKQRDDKADHLSHLRKKYAAIWGKRGMAKVIAIDEGIAVETVRRYFRESK